MLTVGIAVPLSLVGFYNLWESWNVSRAQLNESVERQAELAATAFEQWIAAQTQTLTTISNLSKSDNPASLKDYLNSIVKTRPHWLDVQIVNQSGEIILSQNVRDKPLPLVSIQTLSHEMALKKSLVIFTEQVTEDNVRLLSLAFPIGDGNFVAARIDGAGASNVFRKLNLPEEHIIAVFDSNNRLLYRNNVGLEQVSSDVSDTPLLSAISDQSTATIEVESPYDKIRRVYGISRVETGHCVVAVGVPSEKLYAPAKQQYRRQLWVGALISFLAVLLVLYIARGIVQPIRRLSDAARAFGAGDLQARADISREHYEIRELGETFNQMAGQIGEREERQRELDNLKSEFVSSVSHELRTPLTTIKTLVRVLQGNNISGEEKEEYLQAIAVECNRQIEFVQNLLDLTRIESDSANPVLMATNIVEVLEPCIETYRQAAFTNDLGLKLSIPAEAVPLVLTNPQTLRRIVSSLIENAVKYTPPSGEITVSIVSRESGIAVMVADTGRGISREDLPHIFDKFYQGKPLDEDPTPAAAGIGLGLYLVKSLVRRINAEISVESPVKHRGRGTCFTLIVPFANGN